MKCPCEFEEHNACKICQMWQFLPEKHKYLFGLKIPEKLKQRLERNIKINQEA